MTYIYGVVSTGALSILAALLHFRSCFYLVLMPTVAIDSLCGSLELLLLIPTVGSFDEGLIPMLYIIFRKRPLLIGFVVYLVIRLHISLLCFTSFLLFCLQGPIGHATLYIIADLYQLSIFSLSVNLVTTMARQATCKLQTCADCQMSDPSSDRS